MIKSCHSLQKTLVEAPAKEGARKDQFSLVPRQMMIYCQGSKEEEVIVQSSTALEFPPGAIKASSEC